MNETRAITISAPLIPTISEVESIKEICKVAAYSGFLTSNAAHGDMAARTADAFFVVMYGRELGIPAMTALRNIYVVDGKPSCSGEMLLGLMLKGGVQVKIPDPAQVATDGKAEIQIKRPGGEWRGYTFTREMAKQAGLLDKGTWKKYEAQMMIWRAVSMGAKYECADLTGGMRTIEELAPDTAVDEQGVPTSEIVEATPFPFETNGDNPAPEVTVTPDEPSASVRGAGVSRPTPPAESNPLLDNLEGEPVITAQDPREADDLNLYHCDRIKINETKTAKQFILFVHKSATKIVVTDTIVFEGLTINGVPIIELPSSDYPLEPMWSVYADSDGKHWETHSIEADIPA